jgi:GntR family transcriptional regulator
MIFKLNPSAGQPLYLQIIQQVRCAVETGVLRDGDLMPGIRTLAEQMVVSHNTVIKAYTELQHEGLLELRHGSGAYISVKRRVGSRAELLRIAQEKVAELVMELSKDGLSHEEIQRLFESATLYSLR